jgi:hypothetical protein
MITRPAAASVVHAVWAEHAVLLRLLAAHLLLGGIGLLWMGRPWPLRITTSWFAMLWLSGSGLWLLWQGMRSPAHVRRALSPSRLAGALLVVLLAVPAQITFQAVKQALGPVAGWHWDAHLAAIDRALHGRAAWKLVAPLVHSRAWLIALDWAYMLWFVCLAALVIWLSWTSHRRLRQRALVSLLLLWMTAGIGLAWAFSSAGPCYYREVVGIEDPSATELLARIDAHGPTFARRNQHGLWSAYQADRWLPFGGISAFPSLHVGLAVLIALIAWQRLRPLGGLCWLYAGVVQVGSVALAWHYAIDGYAGALLAWGCWRLSSRLLDSTDAATASYRHTAGGLEMTSCRRDPDAGEILGSHHAMNRPHGRGPYPSR